MSQNLSVEGFNWVENTSQFNKDFVGNYNKDSDEERFLEIDVQYLEKFHDLHSDLYSLPIMMKTETVEKLQPTCMIKKYVIRIRNLK